MILDNTVLVCYASGFIGGSSIIIGSCWLVELMFFLVWWMWPLAADIDGGRCLLISLIVRLGNAEKYPFLIACMRVCLIGLNSVVWYHCSRSCFVISAIKLFVDWRVGVGIGCGVVASCNWYMPAADLRFPYRTTSNFFFTVMLVAVNVAGQTLLHIWSMEISTPNGGWGNMCDVLALVYNKGLGLSSSVWVSWMMLPSGRTTRVTCCVFTF